MKSGDKISISVLIEKHKGVCQLCKKKVDLNADMHRDDAAPTIDHIKPIAKGGLHKWNNVQLACRKCNSLKSDKWNDESNGSFSGGTARVSA